MYSCSSLPAFISSSCAMPWTRTSKLILKSRSIHWLHLPSSSVHRLAVDVDRRRSSRPVPVDRERKADVLARLQLGELRPVAVARAAARLAPHRAVCCLTIGFGGPTSSVVRRVAVEHQPLQDAAELGVAFFVSAQIGREVVERPHRPADVGQRQARQQLAVRDVLRRKRHRHGQHARSARRRCPAVTQNDVPPRIDVHLRFRDREVVEEKLRRLAPCTMPRSGR